MCLTTLAIYLKWEIYWLKSEANWSCIIRMQNWRLMVLNITLNNWEVSVISCSSTLIGYTFFVQSIENHGILFFNLFSKIHKQTHKYDVYTYNFEGIWGCLFSIFCAYSTCILWKNLKLASHCAEIFQGVFNIVGKASIWGNFLLRNVQFQDMYPVATLHKISTANQVHNIAANIPVWSHTL